VTLSKELSKLLLQHSHLVDQQRNSYNYNTGVISKWYACFWNRPTSLSCHDLCFCRPFSTVFSHYSTAYPARSNVKWGSLSRGSGLGMKLTTHRHLVSRLGILGPIPPLLQISVWLRA
jgi:hypothetical protein